MVRSRSMKRRGWVVILVLGAACSQGATPIDAGVDGSGVDGASADGGADVGAADQAVDTSPEAGDASANPAAASCASASASPVSVTYTGSTCGDGTDQISLSCNSGTHPEVVVRVDGATGEVWKITPSPGLAFAMYLGTSCSGSPLSCASGSLDAGGGIADGPFPTNRTDYFVFETMAPTACGAYSITVVRQ